MKSERVIPGLYETEAIPTADKIVVEHWYLPKVNFHWWVVEHDPEDDVFFCYANLNDDVDAEWGYTSRAELIDNCALVDTDWTPKRFKDCVTSSLELARLYPPPKRIPVVFCCL